MSSDEGKSAPDEAMIARREKARRILCEAESDERRDLWALVGLVDALDGKGNLRSEAEILIVEALVRLDETG